MLNDQDVDLDELPLAPVKEIKGVGRPSKYDPKFHPVWARKLGLLSATNPQMADFFGVAESTLKLWLDQHEEFSAAVKAGKDEADARVAQSLYRKALGYYKTTEKATAKGDVVTVREFYPPDTASAIFWLKNRRKADWRDRSEQDVNHKHSLSEEFEAFVREMNARKPVKTIDHEQSDSNVSRDFPSEYLPSPPK